MPPISTIRSIFWCCILFSCFISKINQNYSMLSLTSNTTSQIAAPVNTTAPQTISTSISTIPPSPTPNGFPVYQCFQLCKLGERSWIIDGHGDFVVDVRDILSRYQATKTSVEVRVEGSVFGEVKWKVKRGIAMFFEVVLLVALWWLVPIVVGSMLVAAALWGLYEVIFYYEVYYIWPIYICQWLVFKFAEIMHIHYSEELVAYSRVM